MNLISRTAALLTALAATAALLAACGGGTSQLEIFKPDRVIAFGDEHSLLTPTGRKYSVNALKTDGTLDCEANPLWVQSVAALYGYRFAECLGTETVAKAFSRAAVGATVQAVTAQIDAQVAAGGLTNRDLVTMLVGIHDVKAIYENRAAGETDAQLIARAGERGAELGRQINRIVALGPRVIVSTITELGRTPYGLAKGAADAALLNQISYAFNARMRVTILLDGRFIGLVLGDETVQSAVQVPEAFGFTNVVQGACAATAAMPNCDNVASSLATGATSNTWLWADSLRYGPTMQRQIGLIAASRAQSNPF
jgi:outer membrane lipase/esterase